MPTEHRFMWVDAGARVGGRGAVPVDGRAGPEVAEGPVLAALAVLVEDDRVLLVRRRNPPDAGLWGYPGGRVEPGETVFAAAERELAEETGVKGEARDFLTIVEVIRREDRRLAYHFALAAVLCARRAGEPVAADDVSEAAWVPLAYLMAGRLATSERVPELARLAHERLAGLAPS